MKCLVSTDFFSNSIYCYVPFPVHCVVVCVLHFWIIHTS